MRASAAPTWPALTHTVAAATAAAIVSFSLPSTAVADEYYLPRLLYPGTYANYCGPTPEFPTGWHGDSPVDAVDRACQTHDASYDACAASLRARQGERATPKLLSVLTALRVTGLTTPVMEYIGVDDEYLRCAHAADQGLIRDGIRVRGESQRAMCQGSEDAFPRWFCDLNGLTLARIERIDFDLFLADLDWDDRQTNAVGGPGLRLLEATRRATLKRAATRAPLAQAWESVREIEAEMFAKLK